MEQNMKGFGGIIKCRVKASSGIMTATFTKGIGKMIKQTEKEFTFIKMELNMKGNGRMINKMVMAKKFG